MKIKQPQITSSEFNVLHELLSDIRREVRELKDGVHTRIDTAVKSVKEAFQGFGILDPEEEMWTEKQVCERYHVDRKTMYRHRKAGRITGYKYGKGKNCKIYYRKADVIELFSTLNA